MSDQGPRHGMRWTPEEHRLFVEALQQHPRGKWEEIAAAIGTRTPRQTRKHAEKLQEKIKRRQRRADASTADAADDESFGDDEEEIQLIVDLLRHRSRANAPSAPASEAPPSNEGGLQTFTAEELEFLADLLLADASD